MESVQRFALPWRFAEKQGQRPEGPGPSSCGAGAQMYSSKENMPQVPRNLVWKTSTLAQSKQRVTEHVGA